MVGRDYKCSIRSLARGGGGGGSCLFPSGLFGNLFAQLIEAAQPDGSDGYSKSSTLCNQPKLDRVSGGGGGGVGKVLFCDRDVA